MINNIHRMCLVTHQIKPVSELIRIVRLPNKKVQIDIDSSLQGRGAYISKDKNLVLIAKKKNLIARSLKCNIPNEIYDELLNKI